MQLNSPKSKRQLITDFEDPPAVLVQTLQTANSANWKLFLFWYWQRKKYITQTEVTTPNTEILKKCQQEACKCHKQYQMTDNSII